MIESSVPHRSVGSGLSQYTRRAFDAMVADAGFREEIGRLGFEPDTMRGEDLAGFVAANFAPAAELVARLKASAVTE